MKDLLGVYLVIFLITMSKGTMNVIFPPFLETRAYAVSQIGVLTSLFAVFQLIARLPSGLYYTAQRARLALSGGLVVLGFSAVGFVLFIDTPALVTMIVLNGFAFGAITTIALALCIDAKPLDYPSGAMMGWYTSAIAAGYAIGQPVGGYLADIFGYSAGFASTAVFSLVAILIILSLPEVKNAGKVSPPQAAMHSRPRWKFRFDPRKIPTGVLLATMIVFFVNLMFRSLHTFFPIFALSIGLSLTQVGFLRSALATAAAVVRPFSGKLFQWMHHRQVTHLAMVAAAGAVVLSPMLGSSMTWLILLFAFMGISRGLLRVTSATFVAESNDQVQGQRVGIWSGVYNAGLDSGSIAGPAVGGFLAAWIGIPAMLAVVPFLALGMYVVVSLLAQRRRRQVFKAVVE